MSRLVVDAHVHAQRFAPGFLRRGEGFEYADLENSIMSELPFDNSRALLADMDRLGIDMACVLAAFAMRNEMTLEQIRRHPDRFVGFCGFVDTARAEWSGQAEFDPEKAAEEVDFWLSNGFTGVGELLGMLPAKKRRLSVDENLRLMWPVLEVCRRHGAPVLFHTGCIAYPDTCRLRAVDPILIDDIASEFHDVPLIVGHAGVQTGWYSSFPEHALMVAARHPNVYLELSQCQQSQIERILHDPNIGPDRMLFGSDWGASVSYRYYGQDRVFAATPPSEPPTVLPLHIDWNLRQLLAIEMPEEDRAKVLGENMARLCGIDIAEIQRRKEARYGERIDWEEIELRWSGAATEVRT
jgi:predicted TIM-barrel fold metal-dependent hydrolase